MNAISNAYITETYENYRPLYIDVSVIEQKTGSALLAGNDTLHWRLPDGCSIFRTELFAIEQALKIIITDVQSHYAIYSDSLSCINKLRNINWTKLDPVLSTLVDSLQSHTMQNKHITIVWIPAHVGIAGNEAVGLDKLARQATTLPQESIINLQITTDDCFTTIRSFELSTWQNMYDKFDVGSHYKIIGLQVLHQVKMQLQTRRSDVLIGRLRLGRCLSNATLHQFNVQSGVNYPNILR